MKKIINIEIADTNSGIVMELNNGSNLLVSFGGVNQGLGMPVFEFFKSISDLNCDKVFLRDFNQAWYQKGVDSERDRPEKIISYLKKIILEGKYKKVCFIGNSMGGYAAILFGTILNVDTIISFSPQSFIDKWNRFIHFDSRWGQQIKCIHNYQDKKAEYFDLKKYLRNNGVYKSKIKIYYSGKHRLDKGHAERLKDIENVTLMPLIFEGHSVIKALRDNGDLKKIIKLNVLEQ